MKERLQKKTTKFISLNIRMPEQVKGIIVKGENLLKATTDTKLLRSYRKWRDIFFKISEVGVSTAGPSVFLDTMEGYLNTLSVSSWYFREFIAFRIEFRFFQKKSNFGFKILKLLRQDKISQGWMWISKTISKYLYIDLLKHICAFCSITFYYIHCNFIIPSSQNLTSLQN